MKTAKLMAVACLLLAGIATPFSAANAAPMESPGVALGNDISWPQCGGGLPAGQSFAIVGVNGGWPESANPCLAEQLQWAASSVGGTSQPAVALYVNTGNPAEFGPAWWPSSNGVANATVPNPYGTCDGSASAACAYIYGYTMAFQDANQRGVSDPAKHMWWLDVETGNAWSWDKVANAADIEGMAAYLQSIGAAVGIYSTSYQFGIIAGRLHPDSNLNGLKSWLAGATSPETAVELCSAPPLTAGGVVALTQFTTDLDYNYSCIPPAPPAPPKPAPVVAPPKPPAPTLTEDASGKRKPDWSIPQS
ncbi:glycoside hydrolase family 25 domain-containing protein [Arthrobacter sp. B2a2-09]|uniref:hypothetical protein n=1 Tax=Arthrobacter sp. B2a2-09 TaxID=2952822 RepID=UPI0022CD6919|nr:hypothetical protein [Arthrobacter sp. B2a2-09]MCZ9884517.1 hypothetical protein [Arthrobacter sp. B2a2-09]